MSARPSFGLHVFNNTALICLSLFVLPITTTIVALSLLYDFFNPPHIAKPKVQKTVLITSCRMEKSLTLCRAFHLAGHRVIAAEHAPYSTISYGRYSKSVHKFHSIPRPSDPTYSQALQKIALEERVDLWIPITGVDGAIPDANAAVALKAIGCESLAFTAEMAQTLDAKPSFIQFVHDSGLDVPQTTAVTSHAQVMDILDKQSTKDTSGTPNLIFKSVCVDNLSRISTIILPRKTRQESLEAISIFPIGPTRPYILQEFIHGDEYCTHAVIINGVIKAFVACPSSELLMHYEALPHTSKESRAMERFTRDLVKGTSITGHLSVDFMIKRDDLHDPNATIIPYPIECNPRCHTAVVLLTNPKNAVALTDAYLSILSPESPSNKIVYATTNIRPRYWLGHDLFEFLILPVRRQKLQKSVLEPLSTLFKHISEWKEATFEVWDPIPFWWFYHVHWPSLFLWSLWTGERWYNLNISTTKLWTI